jgi:hypothetical protein
VDWVQCVIDHGAHTLTVAAHSATVADVRHPAEIRMMCPVPSKRGARGAAAIVALLAFTDLAVSRVDRAQPCIYSSVQ